jgi:glycolate dehydrogenase FAD-binding subunit
MAELSDDICATVHDAYQRSESLYIAAGGSKRHIIGRDCEAAPLDVCAHRGIIDYQPDELVLCARAGTPLGVLQEALAQYNQVLPFDPPLFGDRATLGGTLACNLSGPARPWYGSIRDATLGIKLVNGKGELLQFGGKVMKNVAGYDVSRLQAGALGTLGVITEVNLKVLPKPESSVTLAYSMDAATALATMNRRAVEPKPLSGACWFNDTLYLRLSGAASAVRKTASSWGGSHCDETETPWAGVREMDLPFFSGDTPLWRLSCSPNHPLSEQQQLLDWGGAQRWIRAQTPPELALGNAHLSLFAGGDRRTEVRGVLDPVQQTLQKRLKAAFDPRGVLNPGRLYGWM